MFSRSLLFRAVLLIGLGAAGLPGMRPAMACGQDCDYQMSAGQYRAVLPPARDGQPARGAILFIHGYKGTATGILRNKRLLALGAERNLVVIAAQSSEDDWNIPNSPSAMVGSTTDTLAYFDALRRDVIGRFELDPAQIVVAGFSSGGMMTWHLACNRGTDYAGFVPMSGTFWLKPPETCPTGAVNLIHYHARQDRVVPLEGRRIGTTRQGKVAEAIAFMRMFGGYQPAPIPAGTKDDTIPRDCEAWESGAGKQLQLCLFDGGHSYRVPDLARALDLILPEG